MHAASSVVACGDGEDPATFRQGGRDFKGRALIWKHEAYFQLITAPESYVAGSQSAARTARCFI